MKIPFDIKFRPQIESGEYKVETRDGQPSRILCWDRRGERSLVVLVQQPNGFDDVLFYYESGLADGVGRESDEDLFIVIPEPELSEFEKAVDAIYESCGVKELQVKKKAAELLSLARKQFIKDGELLTQEHHEKLMETQYNETLDGVKKNWRDYFTPQAITDIYNAGRNDVLKDLPRWKRIMDNGKVDANGCHYTDSLCLIKQGWYVLSEGAWVRGDAKYLSVADLEKLPGFKDGERHE